MKFYLLLLLLALSSLGFSEPGKLTAEYKKLRTEMIKEYRAPYRKCRDSAADQYYTKMVKQCLAREVEERHTDGCGHEAQQETERYITSNGESAFAQCDKIKGTKENFFNLLDKRIKDQGINKYE